MDFLYGALGSDGCKSDFVSQSTKKRRRLSEEEGVDVLKGVQPLPTIPYGDWGLEGAREGSGLDQEVMKRRVAGEG